jgi:hypothetical protein
VSHALTVEELRRWEDHGATWRVRELGPTHVELELCSCVGEPVDRAVSDDAAVIAFVRSRSTAQSD